MDPNADLLFAARRGADIVVVGAGLAGLAVAADLANAGVGSVLVLETGPEASRPRRCPQPTAAPAWRTATAPHYAPPAADAPDSALPGVGGRSLYWHGVLLPIEDFALQDAAWPDATHGRLLGSAGAPGLYAELQAELWAWSRQGPELQAAWQRQDAADDALIGLLGFAGQARRVPQAVRPTPVRRPFTPLDRLTGDRATPVARVLPDTRVLGVQWRGGSVQGVRARKADGATVDIAARVVVLAAGTIANTALLAAVLGQRSFEGLNDHLTQGFVARIPAARVPPALREGAFALLDRDSANRCNLFVRLHPADAPSGDLLLDVWALGEQERSAANRIDVTPSATGDRPTIEITAGFSDADRRVLSGAHERLQGAWATLAPVFGLAAAALPSIDFEHAPRPFHAARALAAHQAGPLGYAWPLGAGDHEGGTLPLGAVLDAVGGVPGVDGLYVVGPAVFPRAGAANPSLTTLALARQVARTIAGVY